MRYKGGCFKKFCDAAGSIILRFADLLVRDQAKGPQAFKTESALAEEIIEHKRDGAF